MRISGRSGLAAVRRGLTLGLLLVSALVTAQSPGAVVALKRDAGLTAGGAIDSRFNGVSVTTTTVNDAGISASPGYAWLNWGAATMPTAGYNLFKFDLSSIPAGSRINLAQLRLLHRWGNGTYGYAPIGMVLNHTWSEGNKNGAYPGASPSALGVSGAHPAGTNTGSNQNASGTTTPPLQTWGPTSDSFFSLAGDVATLKEPSDTVIYHVFEVTSQVQCWVSNKLPNYGWAHYHGNWEFKMSEAGTVEQPVLFIDYTPGGGSPDATAPAAVADLGHDLISSSWVRITWQAPGDDGATGTAYYYDLRYSTSPINEGNWATATQLIGEPVPGSTGASQSYFVENVTPGATLYFAIKTYDELWNASPLSNVHQLTMNAGTPAPARITNLDFSDKKGTHVELCWTAPGADYQSGGPAAAYDLGYSTSPITEDNWNSPSVTHSTYYYSAKRAQGCHGFKPMVPTEPAGLGGPYEYRADPVPQGGTGGIPAPV